MRDDLKKLPLPPEAKSYARRKGLSAMKKQPQSFINMVAAVTNQKSKKHGFKNTDEVGTVPKAIKESARMIVAWLLEADDEEGYQEFKVFRDKSHDFESGKIYYAIQVPYYSAGGGTGMMLNYVAIPDSLGQANIQPAVEKRMMRLASERRYPTASFFVTPWGEYLIHGGTIGKI